MTKNKSSARWTSFATKIPTHELWKSWIMTGSRHCMSNIYIYKPYVNQICSVSYIHYTNNIHNQGELVDNPGGFIYIYIYNSYIIPYLKTPKNPKGFCFFEFRLSWKNCRVDVFFRNFLSLRLQAQAGGTSGRPRPQIRWDLAAK